MAVVPNPTRAEQVLEILTKEILSGQYRAGERLPSERELAARFETNRGAIREALKKLEQLGIARVQPGGTRVAPIDEATLDVIGALLEVEGRPSPSLVAQVIEAMAALTTLAVRLTVERASNSDIDELRSEITVLQRTATDVAAFMDAFVGLNNRFMQASGNLVLRLISNSMHLQVADREPPAPERLHFDKALLEELDDGLRLRNPEMAVAAMSRLMQVTGRQIVQASERAERAFGTV